MTGPISLDALVTTSLTREGGRLPLPAREVPEREPSSPQTDDALVLREAQEALRQSLARFGREAPLRNAGLPPPPGSLLDIRV